MRDGIVLSHLPGTPGPRPRRPLGVRLRGLVLRPEVAGIALALFLALVLGASNGFQALHVLGSWLVR